MSVVVPCFNYGHWLTACVESALEQPAVCVDVVIVDDASTDDSVAMAERLVARDPSRVRLIRHAVNHGHIPSVNEGLRAVSGEYLVKLDADDLLSPGCLARAIALLEAHPRVGFVYGRPLHFGSTVDTGMSRIHRWLLADTYCRSDIPSQRPIDQRVRGWTVWAGFHWIDALCRRGANCISQPEVVMRTSTVRMAGPYDAALPHTSDLAMWLRLATIADVGRVDGPIQGFYRVHPGSMQRTVNAGKVRDLQARRAAFEAVLVDAGSGVPGAARMLQTVRARLAGEALDEACRIFDRGLGPDEPLDEYVGFATATSTEARALASWRALQRRRRIGRRWAPRFPPFLAEAAWRRAKGEVRAVRWWRYGT